MFFGISLSFSSDVSASSSSPSSQSWSMLTSNVVNKLYGVTVQGCVVVKYYGGKKKSKLVQIFEYIYMYIKFYATTAAAAASVTWKMEDEKIKVKLSTLLRRGVIKNKDTFRAFYENKYIPSNLKDILWIYRDRCHSADPCVLLGHFFRIGGSGPFYDCSDERHNANGNWMYARQNVVLMAK